MAVTCGISLMSCLLFAHNSSHLTVRCCIVGGCRVKCERSETFKERTNSRTPPSFGGWAIRRTSSLARFVTQSRAETSHLLAPRIHSYLNSTRYTPFTPTQAQSWPTQKWTSTLPSRPSTTKTASQTPATPAPPRTQPLYAASRAGSLSRRTSTRKPVRRTFRICLANTARSRTCT